MQKVAGYCAAAMLTVLAMATRASAGTNPVPEIDASAVSAGLGLLAAGVLMVRSRRRSK